MTTTADDVLQEITKYLCNTKYATCPEIIRAISIGGAIAFQLGSIPAYRIRKRQLGFDLNGRSYKFRFRHRWQSHVQEFDGVELVEYEGSRDVRVIRTMRSVKNAHGILADL